MTPGHDPLRDVLNRVNGHAQVPTHVPRKPSGYLCPKCGDKPLQAIAPSQLMGGVTEKVDQFGRPEPESMVITADEDGVKTQEFRCLRCLREWQQMKMLADIREHGTLLQYVGVEASDGG